MKYAKSQKRRKNKAIPGDISGSDGDGYEYKSLGMLRGVVRYKPTDVSEVTEAVSTSETSGQLLLYYMSNIA